MNKGMRGPDYGNWMPLKMVAIPAALGTACFALGFLRWFFFLPAAAFWAVAVYFCIVRFLFSPRGGGLQDRVRGLVMDGLRWPGRGEALDIGCGNGPLAIRLAQAYPEAKVVGLDSWGGNWEYSMDLCARNAKKEGVDTRVVFRQGSASSLPFKDASFDLVVSNLVFHDVRDAADKRLCIREALRVLKPGGSFLLQDLFLIRPYYGSPEDLVKILKGWGAREVEFLRTCDEPFIPGIAKLPFILGTMAVLRGMK